jgi:hypothetical protein
MGLDVIPYLWGGKTNEDLKYPCSPKFVTGYDHIIQKYKPLIKRACAKAERKHVTIYSTWLPEISEGFSEEHY